MKNKIYKVINIILIILFAIILILSPLFIGVYKTTSIEKYITIFAIINVLGLIVYLIKPYKLDKKILYYVIFVLTYFLPLIHKDEIVFLKEHYQIILLVILLLGTSINAFHVFKQRIDLLNKIVIIATTTTALVSIIYNFYPVFFNSIGIFGNYGDYYLSSVNRLYGTFQYPNTLALFSLIGIILSLKYYKTNILFKITIYLNTLTLLLTMSKTVLIFTFIVFIIFIIIDKNTIKLLASMVVPMLINVNNYRNAILNNDMFYYISITLGLILLFLLIYKYWKKRISMVIIIILLLVGLLLPSKPLKVEKYNNRIFITEFFNLKGDYELVLNVKGDVLKENVYMYKHYIENGDMVSRIEKYVPLDKTTRIKFRAQEKAHYYSLQVKNIGSTIVIENAKLKSKDKEEDIALDYYIFPYNYIQSIKQGRYDIGSLLGRFEIYKFSIGLIKEKPLTGHGFDYFKTRSIDSENVKNVLVEHSQIMTIGVQNGIFGIIAWCSLIFMIIINCIRAFSKRNIYHIVVIFLLIYASLYDSSMSYHYLLLLFFIYSLTILNDNRKDIMYICSSGGHLGAMKKIMENIESRNTILITERRNLWDIENAQYVLSGSRGQLFRYMLILPINLILNIVYFIHYNPKIIITTGSHTGVFMCYLGKIFKRKIIFIEVFDRFKKLTLSGKMVYKIADYFIVQHKTLLKKYPKAKYIGEMY